jgi:asparagine synthase (glutamine-hydrolysing)
MNTFFGIYGPISSNHIQFEQRAKACTAKPSTDEPFICKTPTHQLRIYGIHPHEQSSLTHDLYFDGQLFNRRDLEQKIHCAGSKNAYMPYSKLIGTLFHKYKEKSFAMLNGQYHLVVFNRIDNQLFITQNPYPSENIYYTQIRDLFLFSNRLKKILYVLETIPDIDPVSLRKYFAYGCVPSPHTLLSGIYKIPLSSYLQYHDQTIHLKKYWNLSFDPNPSAKKSLEDYSRSLYQKLSQSTQKRINPEKRYGAYLSGGLDSSAVVSAICQHLNPSLIKTYTAVFNESSFDESNQARAVARYLGTDHTEIIFTPRKALAYVNELIQRLEEPFSDDDVICGGILSKEAENHVNEIFVGDGPDELLMGYPSLLAHSVSRYYEMLPHWVQLSIQKIVKRMPVSYRYCSFDSRFKQFLGGIGYPEHIRDAAWWGPFPTKYHSRLFQESPVSDADIYNDVDQVLAQVNPHDPIERIITIYMNLLSERWLSKLKEVDRGTPLNFNIPFLDPRLIDHVNKIPSHFKNNKQILRQSLRPYLPKPIFSGKKRPFFVPLAMWIKTHFSSMINEAITQETINELGLNDSVIQTLLKDHEQGRENNAKQIWSIFILAAWYRGLKSIHANR